MLDPLDEYPIHQNPVSITENGLGANAYDRYFFNGYNHDGSVFFALAFGVYPNRGIVDAAFCVMVDGVQHSVFASGRFGRNRSDLSVGPIRIEIEEPMARIKVVVDHPAVAGDLLFSARTPPVEEPRFSNHQLSIGVFDYTRYTQFGVWSGSVVSDGQTIDVSGAQGCRDRSWGQRGGRGSEAPPVDPQFFWLWTPLNFPDGALHLDVNEYSDGRRWHDSGFSAPLLDGEQPPWEQPVETMRSVDYSLVLEPGTRWMQAAELTFQPWRGDPVMVRLTSLARFQMSGVGYNHPRFRHGNWLGESVVESERMVTAELDPTQPGSFHVQHVVEAERSGQRGLGVLELLIFGPHPLVSSPGL